MIQVYIIGGDGTQRGAAVIYEVSFISQRAVLYLKASLLETFAIIKLISFAKSKTLC